MKTKQKRIKQEETETPTTQILSVWWSEKCIVFFLSLAPLILYLIFFCNNKRIAAKLGKQNMKFQFNLFWFSLDLVDILLFLGPGYNHLGVFLFRVPMDGYLKV